ncbi:Arginine--tRNA ligase [Candidatus Hartigia pinicola]|nr:Arginine--tRNA ligase [Candidatus Hartigia pinicola]
MNIKTLLSDKINRVMQKIGAPKDSDALVRQSSKTQFGTYQADGVMRAAKKMGVNPRKLAEQIIHHLNLENIANKIEIVGPGFINIFLDNNWIIEQLEKALLSDRLGLSPVKKETIVIDYSGPNIAKQMHVGHLRSTILGDAAVRIQQFIGHKVIRANHVGDWGTQFGMLIAYLEKIQKEYSENISLSDLEIFYRKAKQRYDYDVDFAKRARNYVVKLQSGDKYCRKIWRRLVDITMQHNQDTYCRLNVTLTEKDVMGESLYNYMLPGIVADLKTKGLAVEKEGAAVVYLDEFKNTKGEPVCVIIQKKDGGFLYTTTDIACAKYRYDILHANRVLYYIDSRQQQHLKHVWTIVCKAGYIPPSMSLEHHMFGMMLGKDGKPFKTRSGGTVHLTDLLDEAIERAKTLIRKKNPDISKDELYIVSNVVGIGAIKYADLSKNRTTDYIFDWDSMLAFEGNTAPYMQYAYTRIASIFKKADMTQTQLVLPIILQCKHEISLATRLMQFEETILIVARDGTPHVMCAYLYDLAGLFSRFYEYCPILTAENESQRQSRLKLALLTQKILKTGLNILGIQTVEKM